MLKNIKNGLKQERNFMAGIEGECFLNYLIHYNFLILGVFCVWIFR
jgi:hypothetical protein